MYFLTKQDPNYMPKGSRDPLGFQVLWQDAGRRLIPQLSTVSSSIRDFQVMAMAHAYRVSKGMSERDYMTFFLCLEQLMAYVRLSQFGQEDGFNGIDRTKKLLNDGRDEVELSMANQLLSNQRSYGIWGKYIRPFTDMGLGEDRDFLEVQDQKLADNPRLAVLFEQLARKRGTALKVAKSTLAELATPLSRPEGMERKLYVDYLLNDTCRGRLLELVRVHPELIEMDFYSRLDRIGELSDGEDLGSLAVGIAHTERVLSPLNRIFRHLQTKSSWSDTELAADELIARWSASFRGQSEARLDLAVSGLLGRDNLEVVQGLAEINAGVCARRGSEPWLRKRGGMLDVNHFEGAFSNSGYDPSVHHDYTYFINTWFHLYKQLN